MKLRTMNHINQLTKQYNTLRTTYNRIGIQYISLPKHLLLSFTIICSAIRQRLQLTFISGEHAYIIAESMCKSLSHVDLPLIDGKRPTTLYQNKYIKHTNIHTTHDAKSIYSLACYIIYNDYPYGHLPHLSKIYPERAICASYSLYLASLAKVTSI
jgi:hypothetical protein